MKIVRKYDISPYPGFGSDWRVAELEDGTWLYINLSSTAMCTDTESTGSGWVPSRQDSGWLKAVRDKALLPYWVASGYETIYHPASGGSGLSTKNNDGRNTCVFCGEPTRLCGGFMFGRDYNICTACGR
jgi:hypothetical protein